MTEERIVSRPGLRGGEPCIAGTRITAAEVAEMVAGGIPLEEILGDYPQLAAEDVAAAVAYMRGQ